MQNKKEAKFNSADWVDLMGSTASKSTKMTEAELDMMLYKQKCVTGWSQYGRGAVSARRSGAHVLKDGRLLP